jgi:hypothetical protein
MKRSRLSLAPWAITFLLGVSYAAPPPVHAHSNSDGASSGGYTSTVIANITAPAQNAVFHTGGPVGSMPIDYSADNTAKVVSDGTNAQATFGFLIELFLSPSTKLDDEAGGPLTIYAGVTGTFGILSHTIAKEDHVTQVGGRTARSTAVVTGGPVAKTIEDQHSFSVVSP